MSKGHQTKKSVYSSDFNLFYRFVCNNTIEENILQLQTSKLELAKDVLAGSVKNAGKLTMQDLKTLFNVR